MRRLAGFNDAARADASALPDRRTVTRPDGFAIDGWLTAPAGRRARTRWSSPVHGGPHNAFGERFNADIQHWAAGYAVLAVNPRGSGSYDEAFARAVVGDWGGADFEDLLAVLDDVLADPADAIDPARTAITGRLVRRLHVLLGDHPDRPIRGRGRRRTDHQLRERVRDRRHRPVLVRARAERHALGGVRPDYGARSAIRFADRVRTPLLLYHGEADLRCPSSRASSSSPP